MQKKAMGKIPFSELPLSVQEQITVILNHRKRIRLNSVVFSAGIIPLSLLIGNYGGGTTGKVATATGAASYLSAAAYFPHLAEHKKENIDLARALKKAQNNRKVSHLLNDPETRFIIVRNDGSIEARKHNPRILFQPIGRRRIGNPVGKEFRQWRKSAAPRKRTRKG